MKVKQEEIFYFPLTQVRGPIRYFGNSGKVISFAAKIFNLH